MTQTQLINALYINNKLLDEVLNEIESLRNSYPKSSIEISINKFTIKVSYREALSLLSNYKNSLHKDVNDLIELLGGQ